ncbi:MAG: hypothetical protein Q8Q88_18005 [Phenylobacterium sp.]|uniref:hypothetical protein n=1 Tax=Phenylobacterium sp. TaxID=1871053 RepID=UPI0027375E8D|nr:hypothetical protein [Phenylobacterium sp.]MDP3748937.1 hypothetical protein [Phenylobacterium sp.]
MKLATILISALTATAAQAQDTRVWSVDTPKEADAWLRYGTPQTDDQPLAFTCVRKSGQVELGVVIHKPVNSPQPASVTVASEAAAVTLRGRAEPLRGGALAGAEFSTLAPMAAAFRKTGLVTVTALGETISPPPAPKGAVRKFFGACK